MDTINNLDKIQSELSNSDIDAWVCPDYRGSNEIFKTLAGGNYVLTRRAILVIPKTDSPKALIHIIDKPHHRLVNLKLNIIVLGKNTSSGFQQI